MAWPWKPGSVYGVRPTERSGGSAELLIEKEGRRHGAPQEANAFYPSSALSELAWDEAELSRGTARRKLHSIDHDVGVSRIPVHK